MRCRHVSGAVFSARRRERLLRGRRPTVALVLAVAWVGMGGGDVAHAARWRAPVDGALIAPFDFDGSRPYAAGRRRGLELSARRGEPVRSACGGEVTFAGRLPGGEAGVTVRCGALAATHLRLASASVHRGARVARGASLGMAAGGSLRLGARRVGRRHGYVDPAELLASGPSAAPPVAPTGPPPRRPRAPAPRPLPPPRPLPLSAPRAGRVPLVAWAGLVLLAVGVPAGGVVRARRRRAGGAARWRAGAAARGRVARRPAGAGGRCR
jgi:hypothetical protein